MSAIQDVIIEEDADAAAPGADAVDEQRAEPAADGLPRGVTPHGDGYRLTLRFPVTLKFKAPSGVREERIAHLDVRRLNGGDLRAMLATERLDGAFMLFERIIELPESRAQHVLDRMDAVDVKIALDLVGFLSGQSRKTGP